MADRICSQRVLAGAFGYRTLLMLDGKMDLFLYQKGTSLWDSCCMEVVAGILGGRVTNLSNQAYTYD